MKKALIVITSLVLILISSCSKNKKTSIEEPKTEQTVVTTSIDSAEKDSALKATTPKIDFDLSNMNYNMISSITFEMLIEPEKYTDKTVKISGQFYTEVEKEVRYYSAIIWDATLCCPAGMDFIPPSTMKFPDDFPPEETQITVTGTLREKPEDGNLLFYANKVEF